VLADIGRRPVVALSRDAAIPRLGRTIIAPCTTTIRGLPSEVLLEVDDDPIPRTSAINLDSIESVAVGVLVERFGPSLRRTHARSLRCPRNCGRLPTLKPDAWLDRRQATGCELPSWYPGIEIYRSGQSMQSVVGAGERLELSQLATLDRRHFTVVRPAHIDAFELLPSQPDSG